MLGYYLGVGFWSSVGNAVASAVGHVGDAVESVVDTVTDNLEDAVNNGVDAFQGWLGGANAWLCAHAGSVACRVGNVVLGGISGLLEGLRDIVTKALGIIRNVGEFLGAVLRLDFAGALGKLGEILLNAFDLVLSIVRVITLGTIIGGIADGWRNEDLRRFVRELINDRFADSPARLGRMMEHLGLNTAGWGLPMEGTHRVFVLDSAVMPLRDWHNAGTIDLYVMAGLLSTDRFSVRRSRTEVRVVSEDGAIESSIPANRYQIADYLAGGSRRLRVYAISKSAAKDAMAVARRKVRKLGVKLIWNEEFLGLFERPSIHTIDEERDFSFDRQRVAIDAFGRFLIEKGYRQGINIEEQCEVLAFTCFKFADQGLGVCAGRNIDEGPGAENCDGRPGRDDSCCVHTRPYSRDPSQRYGAGVLYRDQWPPKIFRYVLAHEMGHYLGLCHYGHDGFQSIMFTPQPTANLSFASWGLFRFYLSDEPEFSFKDAKNVWRFLVTELSRCLEGVSVTDPLSDPVSDPLPV